MGAFSVYYFTCLFVHSYACEWMSACMRVQRESFFALIRVRAADYFLGLAIMFRAE